MIQHKPYFFFLIFLLLFPVIHVAAQNAEQQGYDIMKKVRDQNRIHATQESEVKMFITDEKDRTRDRSFRNIRKFQDEQTNSMVKFFDPPNVRGTSLLSITLDSSSDKEQWIYLPSFRSVKQLSVKEQNQSFMGSDFTNSDIAGRNLNEDTHTLMSTSGNYHLIESIPKSSEDRYSRLELRVHSRIFVPVEIVFYDQDGEKLKTLQNKKVENFDGMYVVTESIMTNHQTDGKTQLEVSNVKVGIRVPDADVGLRGLQK
jgi:outer membrane lipoprotein-sorting protein